jgi:predicted DNA-binding protein with PD1-like motif
MRYNVLEQIGDRRKFVLVLAAGEEAVATIEKFCNEAKVSAASLTGIGAFTHSSLGYFNPTTQEFVQNEIKEQTEVLSMIGTIAANREGAVKLHIHAVLGCRDATTRGGHLVAGHVNPTMELVIEESEAHLIRDHDAVTGLCLLQPRSEKP